MTNNLTARRAAFVLVGLLWIGLPARAEDNEALGILKAMSDYVGGQTSIKATFDSDIEVITPQLEKLQFNNSGEVDLLRPDKMRVERTGGYADVEMVFDGSKVAVLDRADNRYAQFPATGSIEDLINGMEQAGGLALPGADLLLSNSYAVLSADVIEAKHIGLGVIDGVECEHLAFRNFDVDWQLWVAAGDRPVPCKMVITSKTLTGAPQYTLRIKSFVTGAEIAADTFTFAPSAGAKEVPRAALGDIDELPPGAAPGAATGENP